MALSGSSSYYLHRGFSGSGSFTHTGIHDPPGLRSITNPNISVQSNVRDGHLGSTFPVESSSPNFNHGLNIGGAPSGAAMGESGKRKRGRPRKYHPDGTNMSLGLSPMASAPSAGSTTPRQRGRPPGSGRKQQLEPLGELSYWKFNLVSRYVLDHMQLIMKYPCVETCKRVCATVSLCLFMCHCSEDWFCWPTF